MREERENPISNAANVPFDIPHRTRSRQEFFTGGNGTDACVSIANYIIAQLNHAPIFIVRFFTGADGRRRDDAHSCGVELDETSAVVVVTPSFPFTDCSLTGGSCALVVVVVVVSCF